MKKAFSLMEVIIAIAILSFSMVTLLEIKSENIYLLSKGDEIAKNNEYFLLAMDLKEQKKRNEDVRLDDLYSFDKDEIRKAFKDKKIKIKDEKVSSIPIENDGFSFNIVTYSTTYSFLDNKKKIYSFKLEL